MCVHVCVRVQGKAVADLCVYVCVRCSCRFLCVERGAVQWQVFVCMCVSVERRGEEAGVCVRIWGSSRFVCVYVCVRVGAVAGVCGVHSSPGPSPYTETFSNNPAHQEILSNERSAVLAVGYIVSNHLELSEAVNVNEKNGSAS